MKTALVSQSDFPDTVYYNTCLKNEHFSFRSVQLYYCKDWLFSTLLQCSSRDQSSAQALKSRPRLARL